MSFLDEFRRYQREVEEAMSAAHFADPDAVIGDAEYRNPDCPICLREVDNIDGDCLECPVCKVRWNIDGTHGRKMSDDD